MIIVLWVATAAIALLVLDRLLLLMERRGWIYYRKKQPSRTSLGNAFLEIQSILEPSKKIMVVVKKEEKKEQSESGDPPRAGDDDDTKGTEPASE
jgi:hypothetical protein